jgi:hypothetical protein
MFPGTNYWNEVLVVKNFVQSNNDDLSVNDFYATSGKGVQKYPDLSSSRYKIRPILFSDVCQMTYKMIPMFYHLQYLIDSNVYIFKHQRE